MNNKRIIIALLSILFLFVYSCNVTKNIPQSEYLLTKNSIEIDYPDTIVKSERVAPYDLTRFIPLTQTPNQRIFGANIFLWIYNLSDTAKNNGFNRFLRRVGEVPILADTTIVPKIANEMGLYMAGNGFFNAKVDSSIDYKKQRAYVNYSVDADSPYIISELNYQFNNKSLEPIILADTSKSLIRVGEPLSRIVMDSERSRIANDLEDMGYYQFSTANIKYIVDTIGLKNRAKVTLVVNKNRVVGTQEDSKLFRIGNIYVNTNYAAAIDADTIAYDTVALGAMNFIYRRGEKRNIHPDVMARAITLFPNQIYSNKEIEYTSANIRNLNYFKNTSIIFREATTTQDDFVTFVDNTISINPDSLTAEDGKYGEMDVRVGKIDCYIQCTPAKRQSYSVDFEMSTNTNFNSLAFTVGYGNNNIFKRAESFNVNMTASYDFMHSSLKRDSYEFGVGVSYAVPRLLLPNFFDTYKNLLNTSTSLDLSYSTQRRPDYDRNILNASYGYSWSNNRLFTYSVKPLNIGLIQVPWIDEEFYESIENPYLKSSYKSQMIFGTLSSFRYNNSSMGLSNRVNLRFNIETSGNFLSLMSEVFNVKENYDSDSNLNYYNAFGVQYSQYLRSEVDFSQRFDLNAKGSSSLVYRLFAGAGYSYGNSSSMPIERMFYVGGSNSMRGWQIRTLGPGDTTAPSDDDYPQRVGNIRLEANLEGRFPIYGPLNGAIFFDAGNVWYNGKGEDEDSVARFKINDFYKELGFNTGLGARLDFSYFVLRLDWGIKLHDPGQDIGERWIHNFKLSNTALHFAIGYPF
ncbi:MAG: BamA/TamA family outer membrane protein [Rikenellaceae bacterium]